MKNILYIYVLLIALLLTACSSSTQPDNGDTYPFTEGTWQVNSGAQATWQGSNSFKRTASGIVMGSAGVDSTAPDTTYFFSNDSLQAKIMEDQGAVQAEFQLVITTQTLNSAIYDSMGIADIYLQTLGNSFEIDGLSGTMTTPTHVEFVIQMNFDCASTDDKAKDLIFAFTNYAPYQPDNKADTLFYYHLNTDGLFSTVRHIECNSPSN